MRFNPSSEPLDGASTASAPATAAGDRYQTSHAATHTNPIALGNANAQRHPNASVTATSNGGARIDPSIDPPLKIPTASARSRTGNHCDTTFSPPE